MEGVLIALCCGAVMVSNFDNWRAASVLAREHESGSEAAQPGVRLALLYYLTALGTRPRSPKALHR